MAAIADSEKAFRYAQNKSVFGTMAMEAMFPDEPTRLILKQYPEGQLTLEEFSSAMDRHAQTLPGSGGKVSEIA